MPHPKRGEGRGKGAANPNIICFTCHQPEHYASHCKVPQQETPPLLPLVKTATVPKHKKAVQVLQLDQSNSQGSAQAQLENN